MRRIEQHSEDVHQCMADVRLTVERLGRSVDGSDDRDAALDLAKQVRLHVEVLIDRLRESMGDA